MIRTISFILLLISGITFSQEVRVNVSVNYESLQVQNRENLVTFKNLVEDYINKNRWTDINWSGPKIPITMTIFFRSASVNRYQAQVVVTSQRAVYKSEKVSLMLKLLDPSWDFNYEKNQTLFFNPTLFDPLTSFLNYYVYLVLGLDFDSYEPNGGASYFTKALAIANQASSSGFSSGWMRGEGSFSRTDFVAEILNEKFQDFRKSFYEYHYNGLDLESEDPKAPSKNLITLLNNIEEIRSKVFSRSLFLKVFFDTKYLEFCDVLSSQKDKIIFDLLKKIDPAHISSYDKCKKK